MTNETPNPEDIARTLIRNYGDEAPRQAEILTRATFAHNTAETSRFLRDILQALDKARATQRA
jgi:hypothetical protein